MCVVFVARSGWNELFISMSQFNRGEYKDDILKINRERTVNCAPHPFQNHILRPRYRYYAAVVILAVMFAVCITCGGGSARHELKVVRT